SADEQVWWFLCLDPWPLSRQCHGSGPVCGMKLLSHLSPDGGELPAPADARHLYLGFEAWREAVALAPLDHPASDIARGWSATSTGKRLLSSIFGNSPFLSGVAVKEWFFLTRLVEEGADPLFSEIIAESDHFRGDTAALMQRLRIAKR